MAESVSPSMRVSPSGAVDLLFAISVLRAPRVAVIDAGLAVPSTRKTIAGSTQDEEVGN